MGSASEKSAKGVIFHPNFKAALQAAKLVEKLKF
jgi:hypothetical protein